MDMTAQNNRTKNELEIARIIFDAFRRANPRALFMGDSTDFENVRNSDVLIDGTFNFRVVARFIRREFEKQLKEHAEQIRRYQEVNLPPVATSD